MPVVLAGQSGYLKLTSVCIDKSLLTQLSVAKAKIDTKPDAINVTINGKLCELKVQLTALKTPLSPYQKVEIEDFLAFALKSGADPIFGGSSNTSKINPPNNEITAGAKMAEQKVGFMPGDNALPEAYQQAVNAMIKHPPVPAHMLTKMSAIPLVDATGLYRVVKGTSPSSKYFLVAVFPVFKMAIKLKTGAMSTRIEGTITLGLTKKLNDMGFSPGTHYWSCHAPVHSTQVAQQYYGAMVSALGGSLLPLADLSVIENKG